MTGQTPFMHTPAVSTAHAAAAIQNARFIEISATPKTLTKYKINAMTPRITEILKFILVGGVSLAIVRFPDDSRWARVARGTLALNARRC